jgi:trans-aconitate methyltransferase
LDVSEKMIALARQQHPQIPFYHADISKWSFPKKYDFISAWDKHVAFAFASPGTSSAKDLRRPS